MAAASPDVGTLKAMFEHWDEATLAEVLAASGNDMDRAAESILTAGSPEAWRAARARQAAPPSPPAAAGAAPQGAVSVVVPPGSRGGATLSMTAHGRSFMVTVPQGLRAGDRFVATIPPPRGAAVTPSDGTPLRGKRVTLPADFLMPPPAARSSDAAIDQQTALFLQHENRRRAAAAAAAPRPAAGARQRSFPSFSRSSGSQPASSGGYSGVLNSAATRAAAAARRAAASAGRGASALKNKVKRAAGGSDRVEIAEQRYGRLDLSDELDDTEPENPLHQDRDPDRSPPAPSRPGAGGTDFREVGV